MFKATHFIIILLVVLCTLMLVNVLKDNNVAILENAYAGGGATGNFDMIDIPLMTDQNEEFLVLIKEQKTRRNRKETPPEWHMVVYSMRQKKLKVEAARNIHWDFHMQALNLARQSKLSPDDMRKRAEAGEDKPTRKTK